MVHVFRIARPRLHELDPFVGLKGSRNENVLIVDDAARRDLIRGRQLEDHVRLGNCPSVHELARRRHILGITLRSSSVHPGHDGIDLALLQRSVVRKLAVVRIGEPRRHFSLQRRGLDRLRPGTRLLIREQGKRRRFTGTVADLAVLLKDRGYIFGEGRGLR